MRWAFHHRSRTTEVADRAPGSGAALVLLVALWALAVPSSPLGAQVQLPAAEASPRVVELNMANMVDLTMNSSFRVRRLNLDIEREQLNLKAERAGLKSSVDMEVTLPAFRRTSEPKWNSTLQRYEIVQEDTRRWEGEIHIRQPVILFGWPTNGYLSINNRMYQYSQFENDGTKDTDYYNRYYISYNQPLFQPNRLKHSLEQAELSLESTQIDYNRDILEIVSGVSEAYYGLLREHYSRDVRRELVANLETALAVAEDLARNDSARANDVDQIQVELANARESLRSRESSIRMFLAEVKQELGLSDTDSISFRPEFRLEPVSIDMDRAVAYALELTPTLRQFEIGLRNQEIGLERTKSWGGPRINLSMSYGREVRDEYFDRLWRDPDNSFTVNLTASIPVWDHGERRARIASSQIGIERTKLFQEETELGIVSRVRNEVLNVRDRESRTMAMRQNLELAQGLSATNLQRYREGAISVQELILGLLREADTNENFLDAYVSWKGSLRSLLSQTWYNFELDRPAIEWLRAEGWLPEDGIEGLLP
jgi:outer membrane protein TolC